ncbi:hypothetical protein PGTUg99_013592 [Puccinia graminis f. sp. tritici]|uniref:Transcription initiation factor IIE subunit beta n=2 Tax=Puccinia graminis f. sp. tritici TaxID=56615 RepID=E3K333_PUCGT|nr:uncharacterized protein PGTG_04846 [Puccinia graminis f. sp. tritici CRL 75-36-700-3]EFP78890.1 hypothetical protein PGTG_04846 [Puccinia graminis f. sp. tritici CRL 75-36-700-3]KAA1112209.1 hypothetical protein PGTUg99_013592 [Puccinia graminis f. sp. tritici]
MASKFPSLPAPRFAPPKPSPLSQPATTAPPEPPKSQPQPSANAPSSSAPPKKKKKKNAQPTAPPVVEDLGPGRQFATQVFKLVDTLKRTNGPMNLSDLEAQTGVRGLLSEHTDVPFNKELFDAFNSHERVNVTEKGLVRLWSYKPDYVINNPKQVLELLERFSGMGGMPVNTLKQSWPNVMTAITELENEGKVLVLRTESVGAKEGTPKTVFYDQLGCRENLGPTRGALDDEFREMWHSLQTPPVHSLPSELQEAGLTSSTSANLKPQQTTRKPKKKGGKGGKVKITNTHLKDLGIDLSKDYVPYKK